MIVIVTYIKNSWDHIFQIGDLKCKLYIKKIELRKWKMTFIKITGIIVLANILKINFLKAENWYRVTTN